MMIIGYDVFQGQVFSSSTPAVSSINYAEVANGVYDELFVRTSTDSTVDTTPTKESWQPDTRLLAKFQGDLEAGNFDNAGLKIVKFALKRRPITDIFPVTVGYVDYVNNTQQTYTDYTAPVGEFIYSIVPVGENGLEGRAMDVEATSDFVGWWIVDKDAGKAVGFNLTVDDQNLSSSGTLSVQTTLNQGRLLIETMNKYPQIYYTDQQYHTFNLSAVLVASDYSFNDYMDIVNMITQRKPLIVKASSGDIYVCDISAPQKTSLLNAFKNYDYISLQLTATEVQDFNTFIQS